MKDSSFCVTVGKYTGTVYRGVAEKSDKFAVYLRGAARSVSQEAWMMWARVENLLTTIKTDSRIAHWEMRRKDDFAKLGEELFRLKEPELEQIFPDSKVKTLLSRVREDHKRILGIEDERHAQHKRMREMTIFRHATAQLSDPQPRMRHAALRVLEKLGKKESIPQISRLLEDPDDEVRTRARNLVRKLSHSDKPPTTEPEAK